MSDTSTIIQEKDNKRTIKSYFRYLLQMKFIYRFTEWTFEENYSVLEHDAV